MCVGMMLDVAGGGNAGDLRGSAGHLLNASECGGPRTLLQHQHNLFVLFQAHCVCFYILEKKKEGEEGEKFSMTAEKCNAPPAPQEGDKYPTIRHQGTQQCHTGNCCL